MATYYLDTSALVKRYVVERGTRWVQALTARGTGHTLYTVRLTGPEMIAALARKVRTGQVSPQEAARAGGNFRQDWRDQYQIIEVDAAIADRAMILAETHGLRGYDAVHLAAGLELQNARWQARLPELTFVSADGDQLQAAVAEALPSRTRIPPLRTRVEVWHVVRPIPGGGRADWKPVLTCRGDTTAFENRLQCCSDY